MSRCISIVSSMILPSRNRSKLVLTASSRARTIPRCNRSGRAAFCSGLSAKRAVASSSTISAERKTLTPGPMEAARSTKRSSLS
ncbi:MAG: hypothetical protein BWX80_03675 [Candidatus Hydrogenedentes bacterium ADurb.Bin101]|nr:MAG: hypothetical protein BWX80_03675 [Candidatus Hydrogenedentes bacterium ADurb.Bin101]